MKFRRVPLLGIVLLFCALVLDAIPTSGADHSDSKVLTRIAFASCNRESVPAGVWRALVTTRPDLFLLGGANIYADTTDMEVMRKKYELFRSRPEYRQLQSICPILATWDDHDYGEDDAGSEYPRKKESEQLMLDCFEVPADSPRRNRPGVYGSYLFGPEEKRVQILLLDTRYFRSRPKRPSRGADYLPNTDPQATVLGDAQWDWLEAQLREPARVRFVVSSIQVIPSEHRFEKWANFPLERKRLFHLINKTGANGVIFLSGDRHLAEISRIEPKDHESVPYPFLELTSSGMTHAFGGRDAERNRFRIGKRNFRGLNFALITINWGQDLQITLEVKDTAGETRLDKTVCLSE